MTHETNIEEFLKEIRNKVYFGEITAEEVRNEVGKAEDDKRQDVYRKCEHSFIFSTSNYNYEQCTKCGMFK